MYGKKDDRDPREKETCDHDLEFVMTGTDESSHMRGYYACKKCGIRDPREKEREPIRCDMCGELVGYDDRTGVYHCDGCDMDILIPREKEVK